MDLTHSDVQSILKIIDAAEHLEEVEITHNGFRLHVVRTSGGTLHRPPHAASPTQPSAEAPAVASKPPPPPATASTSQAAEAKVPDGIVAIRAPMLGVFYRASAPGEKPFVEVGQRVRADDTVCLIEVMKLFSSIRAGVDGEVVKILVDNGGLVEFDQPLIFVAPASKG
jgi:acetyl-CoA carboxylase biotin carboxyl carrier protein